MHPIVTQARKIAGTAHVLAIIGLVCLAVAIATKGGIAIGGYLFDHDASAGARTNGALLALIALMPAIMLFEAVNQLRHALQRFSEGEFFSEQSANHVAQAGKHATLAMVAMILFVPNLERWLRSRGGFDIRIEPEYFGLLAFALFVAAIGRVLALSAQLKAENDAFV
jgi:hypothetical protein